MGCSCPLSCDDYVSVIDFREHTVTFSYNDAKAIRVRVLFRKKIARHGELIRADNAAKQVIVDLRTDYGVNITGVTKGKNSRRDGYDWLRDLDQIIIDPVSCPNAAREFAAYEYGRDKNGALVES